MKDKLKMFAVLLLVSPLAIAADETGQGVIHLISTNEWLGIVVGLIVIVGAIGVAIWKISKVIGSVIWNMSKHDTTLQHLVKSVGRIESILLEGNLVASKGPLSLTEKGEEIANIINIDKIIDQYWANLKKSIDDANITHPYDIQQESLRIAFDDLDNVLTEDEQKAIKYAAYDNRVEYKEIMKVFGIKIKERVLKERE